MVIMMKHQNLSKVNFSMEQTCRGDGAHLALRIVTSGFTPQTKGWHGYNINVEVHVTNSIDALLMYACGNRSDAMPEDIPRFQRAS